MNRLGIYCVFGYLIFFLSCKKEKLPLGGSSGGSFSSVQFVCDTIPPEPPFGWEDTVTNGDIHVIYWAYNPSNSSEIVYMDGQQNLYAYNFQSKAKKFLDNQIMGIPKINRTGWLTYGKLNFCAYVIKTNGDSLKQLNGSLSGQTPSWDYTGNYIYYLQNNICIKTDKEGNKIDSINFNPTGAAFAHTSDSYIDLSNPPNTLVLVNRATSQQTVLTTIPSDHGHLCFDKDDKNLFWWCQFKGLIKFNIQSKKIDTLVRFCENFTVAGLDVSPNSNKLTMAFYQYKQVGSWWKLHKKVDPIEYDVTTKTWRKLNIQF